MKPKYAAALDPFFQVIQRGLSGLVDGEHTDQAEDLRKFDVPTLFIHGDDDQIVPIAASAQTASKLVKGSALKVYPAHHTD